MTLAGHVGHTLAEYTAGRLTNNRDALSGDLLAIFRLLIQAAKEADVSLASHPPGDYLIEITATVGSEKTVKLIGIRVTG